MKGILLGLVQGDEEARIAFKVGGGDSLAVPLQYAMLVWEQLGDLLEATGMFDASDSLDDEDDDDTLRTVQ